MNITRYIAITFGLGFFMLMLLQLDTYLTGNWDTVAVSVADYSVVLLAFGTCVAALFTLIRRRP